MMKILLASGHENAEKAPATAMSIPPKLLVYCIPLVAELEQLIDAGKGWSREYEQRCDEVSIALFGITRADTEPPCPQPDAFYTGRAQSFDRAAYDAAGERWYELTQRLWVPSPQEANDDQILEWWGDRGIDVGDADGFPLRCLVNIDRQLHAALNQLLPGAICTPDGSGKRGAASAEAWGANLAAEAARFKRNR